MHQILSVIVTLLILTSCAAPAPTPAVPGGNGDDLWIEGAWARPSVIPNGNSAIYLTIVNPTDQDDRLLSVSSPAGMAELHESITQDGVARMRPRPEGYEIPKRSTLALEPGGKHIMLMGVAEPLTSGDRITATLVFETMREVTLAVPVREQQ